MVKRSRKVSRTEKFGSYGAHNNKHGGRRSRRRETFGAHNKEHFGCSSNHVGGRRSRRRETFGSYGAHNNKHGGRRSRRKEHFTSCGSHLLGGGGKPVKKGKKSKGKKSKKDTKSNKQSCLQKMNDPKLMLYCLKCKQKRLVSKNGRQCVKTKNNRDMIKAMCSVCGAKCHQFV